MIALIKLVPADDAKNARIAFEACRMKRHSIQQVINSIESSLWILERNSPDEAVNFVPERKQMLGKVTAVLACDSGD